MDYTKKLTTELAEKILSKGVKDMPQNPATLGYNERQIRGYFYIPEKEILNIIMEIETNLVEVFNEINGVVCTFVINTANTTIGLKNLIGLTSIDWGDGTIDANLTHTYTSVGTYTCIIDGVTSIGEEALNGILNLTSIKIGNSVTSIGKFAFNNCKSLTSVVIGKNVTSIGAYAFKNCQKLAGEIVIPNGIQRIENNTFDECRSLTNVIIPSSISSIGNNAFYHCTSLTSIEIPNSVTSIGHGVFAHCTGLITATIPSSIQEFEVVDGASNLFSGCKALKTAFVYSSVIPNGMFRACEGLTEVVISNNTTRIDNYAFWYCSSLTSITIPKSVISIGDEAFRYCSSLKEVFYKGTEEEFSNITIGNLNGVITKATKYFATGLYLHSVQIDVVPSQDTEINYSILVKMPLPTLEVITVDNILTYANYFNNCVGAIGGYNYLPDGISTGALSIDIVMPSYPSSGVSIIVNPNELGGTITSISDVVL